MLAVTATNMVHSVLLTFHYAFKHFEWCLFNDVSNVDFNSSVVTDLVLFRLYVIPKEIVERYNILGDLVGQIII